MFAKDQLLLRRWGPRAPHRTMHSIQVSADEHVIPLPPMHLLNHSCEPNCGLLIDRESQSIQLHALRRVEAGEQLTVDYATFEYEVEHVGGPCRCGAPSCRGAVNGYKDLPQHLRRAYEPYIAQFLRELDPVTPSVR
jgi:hypothetical protein